MGVFNLNYKEFVSPTIQYLVCVCPNRNTNSSCQTKIRNFQNPIFIDKKIVWFKVPVKYSMGMAVLDCQ